MAEEFKVRFKTVFRNVLPAVVVMAAGLVGTYLVYNNYLSDRSVATETASGGDANSLEPAAGDETTTAAPAAAAPAASNEQFAPAASGTAAGTKVYNDEGEDSGNGADATAAPATGTATPPATGDTPAPAKPAPAPATTPPAAQ